eukprot:239327_1
MTSEESDDRDLIAKSFPQHIHQQQLAKGIKYDHYQKYIIASLGGIDNVLSLSLSSNPIILVLIMFTVVILGVLSGCQSFSHDNSNAYLVSSDVLYPFWSFLCLFYSLYIIMWISYITDHIL